MILTVLIISFILALVLSQPIMLLAKKLKIVDVPDASRKFHFGAIPLLGGGVIYFAVILSYLINQYLFKWELGVDENRLILGALIAGGVLFIGGTLDDKFNLKFWQQLFFVLTAIVIMLLAGLKINYISNPLGGVYQVPLQWLSVLLIFFWLLGMTYTTKLLDGVDGLATGISLIAFLYLFFVSLVWDRPQSITPQLILILIGVCIGFLVWNSFPAKIFLGESGSTILGFWLGVLALISGAKIATALVVMAVPVVDVILVIAQRLLKKQSPFSHADRKHLHFRLLDAGLKPQQVVGVLYVTAIIAGSLALLLGTIGKIVLFILLAISTVAMVVYLIKHYDKQA